MRQPQFTERTILTLLWRENARLQARLHLKPCEDHTLPRPCGWKHEPITIAFLVWLNLALAFALYIVWP